MSKLRAAGPFLLLGLVLGGCDERPQFTVKITDLDSSVDTLFVNAAIESPVGSNTDRTDLTFDLSGHLTNGAFDFGLVLKSSMQSPDSRIRGFADLALVGKGCVKQIRRVRLDGPTVIGTPTTLSISYIADPTTDDTVVPLDSRTACYTLKQPLITSIQREMVGSYGDPKTRLVLFGWGFFKQTTATAQLAFPNSGCGTVCSSWDTVTLPLDKSSSFSTTRMAFDASPLNAKLAPVLDVFTAALPPPISKSLSVLSTSKPKSMVTAIFPVKVTLTDTTTGKNDTFSEWP